MKTFHVDTPREIGRQRQKVSTKEMMLVKQELSETYGITSEQAKIMLDNFISDAGFSKI